MERSGGDCSKIQAIEWNMCCLSAFPAGIGIRVTVGGGFGEEGATVLKFRQ